MWCDICRPTIGLSGAGPLSLDMQTDARPGVRWRPLVGRSHLRTGLNKTVIKFVGGGADTGLNHPESGIATD